jgi:hypothetical protein
MAKIENESETKAAPACRRFEVLVSFNGLDKGDTFTIFGDVDWEEHFVKVGYLRELGKEASNAHQGAEGQG